MKASLSEPVTLCLINYNGMAYLQEALSALQNLQTGFNEILVIDNASTDGSRSYLATREEVTVIALEHNVGPAGARNAGFSHARHDIILFQDNDISLTEGAVQALYDMLQQDREILLTMPRVVYRSDPDIIQFEGADCHYLGMMSLRQANTPASQASVTAGQTSSMVSACFMIDRRRWQRDTAMGSALFDESLIFNLEDHDLGVRASLLGYKMMAVPAARVLHGSGTEGLSYRPGRAVSATRMYCLIRNRWWILTRYFSLRTLLVLAPALLLFESLQLAGLVYKGWGREWQRAFADTRSHWPVLHHERQRYQQQRQCADRDIVRDGRLPLTDAMCSGLPAQTGVKLFEGSLFLYWQFARILL